MSKSKLIAELNSEHRTILELVQDFGKNDFDQPGASGAWTAKDVFGHLAYWNGEAVKAIALALHGERPAFWLDANSDEVNARQAAAKRTQSLPAVMEEFRRSLRELITALEHAPESLLERESIHKASDGSSANAVWIAADVASHYRRHRDALQDWLSKN